MCAANFSGDTGKSLPRQFAWDSASLNKLTLATLAELWREGGMQSLGHRSTSLLFLFSSRKFSFLPPPPQKKYARWRPPPVWQMQEATCCAFGVWGRQAAEQSRNNKVDTGPRAVEQQKSWGIPPLPSAAQLLHRWLPTVTFLKGKYTDYLPWGYRIAVTPSLWSTMNSCRHRLYLLGGQPKERNYFLGEQFII